MVLTTVNLNSRKNPFGAWRVEGVFVFFRQPTTVKGFYPQTSRWFLLRNRGMNHRFSLFPIFGKEHCMKNNKKPSQETLIREGDKIRRVRPDGRDGGCFEDGGSGSHSNRRHGNSAEMEDLFHKADDGDQMAKQELDKRGLWLDTSSREGLYKYSSSQLLKYLELTKDTDQQRVKNERQNIMSEIHDRDDVSAEQTIKAMSTEELVVMRNEFIGLGGPPSFLRTAQLVYGELRNRRDQGNNKVAFVKENNSTAIPKLDRGSWPAYSTTDVGNFVETDNSNPLQRSNPLSEEIVDAINDASRQSGMPADLLKGQMAQESSYDIDAVPRKKNGDAIPDTSAYGLMQVTNAARQDVNNTFGTSYTRGDMEDPQINALVGALYWRIIFDESYNRGVSEAEAVKIATAGYFAGRSVTRTAVEATKKENKKLTADNVISNISTPKPIDKKTGERKESYTLDDVWDYLSRVSRFSGRQ